MFMKRSFNVGVGNAHWHQNFTLLNLPTNDMVFVMNTMKAINNQIDD